MRASTRWMMFSARSWSPPEMKILVPWMLYVPSALLASRVVVRRADVGAGVRLGEAHRAAPLAVEHLRARRSRSAPGVPNAAITSAAPCGEPRVHVEGRVGAGQHLLDHQRERDIGPPWPPCSGETPRPLPARLVQLLPRLLEAGRRLDLAVLERAAGAIADRVERAEDLARPPVDAGEDGVHLVLAPVAVGRAAEELAEAELLEEEKANVAEVAAVPIDVLAHVAS